jgi:hypothetical protein
MLKSLERNTVKADADEALAGANSTAPQAICGSCIANEPDSQRWQLAQRKKK